MELPTAGGPTAGVREGGKAELLFSACRLKGMTFRVYMMVRIDRGSGPGQGDKRRKLFYYPQRDERQDPALNRWGHEESDPLRP